MTHRYAPPLLLLGSLLSGVLLLSACSHTSAPQATPENSYQRLIGLAGDLEQRGDPASAASLYQRATEQPEANVDTWLKLGHALLAAHDDRGAERAYQQALELQTDNSDALLGLGTAQLRSGKLDRAVTVLTQAAVDAPQALTFNRLGVAQILRGQTAAAQSAFRSSLKLAPNDLDTQCNLALAYALGGQHEQALSTIRSVGLSPRALPRHQRNQLLVTVLAGHDKDAAALTLEDISASERQTLLVEARRIKAIKDPIQQARELGLVDSAH